MPAVRPTVRSRLLLGGALWLAALGLSAEEGAAPVDSRSLDELRVLARQGDADAQFALGTRYENGVGVGKDEFYAVGWYRRAAKQGQVDGQLRYGLMLGEGRGIVQDKAEGTAWVRKAAEQGSAAGQAQLALAYQTGWGVDEDATEAFAWNLKAARQGLAAAEYDVGRGYWLGIGVAPDRAEGLKWLSQAAEHGDPAAEELLGQILRNGVDVKRDAEQAARWLKRASEHGRLQAQLDLAELLTRGDGVGQDAAQAAAWYRRVVDSTDESGPALSARSRASRALVDLHLGGPAALRDPAKAIDAFAQVIGVPPDNGETTVWPEPWLAAARQQATAGNPTAQNLLGTLYCSGEGVEQDGPRGAALLRRAAAKSVADFGLDLAMRYFNGDCVAQDDREGMTWLKRAAEHDPTAQIALISFLSTGEHGGKDEAEAMRLNRARVGFDSTARDALAMAYHGGIGVKRDDAEALRLVRSDADAQDPFAACLVGTLYRDGEGIPHDLARTYRYYTIAARADGVCETERAALMDRIAPADIERAETNPDDGT